MSEDDEWLKAEHVRVGFDRVMRGVEATPDLAEDFYDSWLPAHRSGDPKEERNAAFLHFGHHGWRWPELDRAAALFATGNWPLSWRNWIAQPYDWDAMPLPNKLQLLVGTLGQAAYQARAAAELRCYYAEDDPFGGKIKASLKTSYPDCPVEQGYIAIYGPAIARGDFSSLPPFFPWNSTSLEIDVPKRRPR